MFRTNTPLFKKDKNNPFAKGCPNCTKNIWVTLLRAKKESNKKCCPNTYVWIEKFNNDNY